MRYGTRLERTLARRECAPLRRTIQAGPDVFALLSGFAAEARLTSVWQPGQTRPIAIWRTPDAGNPAGLRADEGIGANFLILAHGRVEPMFTPVEDGYGVTLSEPLWTRFLAALDREESFVWEVAGGEGIREFAMRVETGDYNSPFGEVYQTNGGFQQAQPQWTDEPRPAAPRLRNLRPDHDVLLTSIDELRQEISAADLAAVIREIECVVDDELDGVPHGCQWIVVEVTLAPGQPPDIRLAVTPGQLPKWPRDRDGADQVRWVENDASCLGAGEYDLAVMSGHVVQIITDNDRLMATFAAIHRALRPGGRLLSTAGTRPPGRGPQRLQLHGEHTRRAPGGSMPASAAYHDWPQSTGSL